MVSQPADQHTSQPGHLPTIAEIRRALGRPLPGLSAQLEMAPSYRDQLLRDRIPLSEPREAGVLILFYSRDGQIYFPLTRRTDTLESHRGQISLPGGAREGAESLQATALRETCEELHLSSSNWSILGRLSQLYIPPSGFLISPFVAYAPAQPSFYPDPVEVAELIETPLTLILNPATVVREQWTLRGAAVEVPFFHVFGHKVWGATAMVLSELITILREASS